MNKLKVCMVAVLGLANAYSKSWVPKTEMLLPPTGYPCGSRCSGKAKERREAKRRRRAKGRK